MTGYHTRSMLCLPIKDSNNEVIGVAQVINKQGDYETTFTTHDSRVFAGYLQFCGIGLKNAQLYERSQLEIKRNQVSQLNSLLRHFAGHIFSLGLDNFIHQLDPVYWACFEALKS